jgi:fermentation-respiration switch protein FrsA (DUF1100 family)
MSDLDLPLLVFHGEADDICPGMKELGGIANTGAEETRWSALAVEHGQALYDRSGASYKRIFRVPACGHNDLQRMAGRSYFDELKKFTRVRAHRV